MSLAFHSTHGHGVGHYYYVHAGDGDSSLALLQSVHLSLRFWSRHAHRVQLAGRCCSPQSQHVSPTTHGLSWRISSSSPAAPLATRRARRPPAPARAPQNWIITKLNHHTAGACQRCMAPAQLRRPPSGTSCAWRTTPRRPRCSCGGSHQPMSCGFCIQRPALAPTSECAGQRQRLTRASRSQRSARTERWAPSRHAACVSLMSRRGLSSKRQRAPMSECRSLARSQALGTADTGSTSRAYQNVTGAKNLRVDYATCTKKPCWNVDRCVQASGFCIMRRWRSPAGCRIR